jgi:hypothetical protein
MDFGVYVVGTAAEPRQACTAGGNRRSGGGGGAAGRRVRYGVHSGGTMWRCARAHSEARPQLHARGITKFTPFNRV